MNPETQTASPSGRLILVSNRLPVTVSMSSKGPEFHPSVGGLATTLIRMDMSVPKLWIGWPGIDPKSKTAKAKIEERLLAEHGCLPLFIPARLFQQYYEGFSNGCLWPLFHYFPQYVNMDPKEWKAYEQVNQMFCDRILSVAKPGDRFWIHDYQLMLLPAMLRKALPDAEIGFFLHICFPAYEMLRTLPWRNQILEGLLGADLIGFHTYTYTRHFSDSLLRLVGVQEQFGHLIAGERPVKVDAFPLGVDMEAFGTAPQKPEVQKNLADLRVQIGKRKLILSVDRLDFTKGIIGRLQAYERFLELHPEWHEKAVMTLVCVPSRTGVPEYAALKRRVDEQVGKINGRFTKNGWAPIIYFYRMLTFEELVPLYLLADVALVTPLRDGMNLIAKEYLASHQDGRGALILSEMAGAARELAEAFLVNPYDTEAVATAIHNALRLPESEQRARNKTMLERLTRYDVKRWISEFLGQLDQTVAERPKFRQRRLNAQNRADLLSAYRTAQKRLLLLDYDGTMVPFVPKAQDAKPDESLLKILHALASDPKNTTVVISGRDHETLDEWLGGLDVHLVSEHGARYRRSRDTEWQLESGALADGWQGPIRVVLEVFADRTPGTYIEDKGTSLVWHYRAAHPQLGAERARELMDTLQRYVSNTPLQVAPGNKVVEVKPAAIGKGKAAKRWFLGTNYDFILAIGDDLTDEDTFRALPERAWTIKVGLAAQSVARFYIPGLPEVRNLLAEMTGVSGKTPSNAGGSTNPASTGA